MPKAKHSLKPLPKTLREKKRYILFKLESEQKVKKRELKNSLQNIFLSLFGSIETAKINPRLIKFNPGQKMGIICFKRGFEENVRLGLLFLQKVKENRVKAHSLKTFGTLQTLQQSL